MSDAPPVDNATSPTPNTPAAIEFLRWYIPDDNWTLTAIVPDGPTETRTFKPTEVEQASAWINKYQGKRNLYYHVNKTRQAIVPGKGGKPYESKPDKEHTLTLRALHTDIDPRAGEDPAEEYERALKVLRAFNPPPSAIIASGGGVNALWKLAPEKRLEVNGKLDKAEELEAYNKHLEKVFGADHCFNIDRLLRLPGSINLPTAKKAKKGRQPTLARLIEFNDHVYNLDQFTAAPRVHSKSEYGELGGRPKLKITGNVQDISTEALRAWATENKKLSAKREELGKITDHVLALIATGADPLDPTKYPSRSEALFKVCCDLVRAGVPDDMIYGVITGSNEIAASVKDKPGWESYALRQIERAHEEAIAPELRELNEKHAVISDWGGKCRVISLTKDEALDRTKISKQSFEDFRNRYCNRLVIVGTKTKVTQKGDKANKIPQQTEEMPDLAPLGAWWIAHPMRRQFDTLAFAPGRELTNAYNLWAGFNFAAIPGDKHESFLKHVKDNVCSGNEECYTYLLGWMARLVQQPGEPGEVSVVVKGKRGTGKSFFAKKLGELFGRHFIQVSNARHLVGNFNAHLRDVVLLFGDEAFWAGDKKHESVLKTLITEEHFVIEGKGVDAEVAPNYVHLIQASNEDWVVPADLDGERRFFIQEISPARAGDSAYFAQIQKDLDSGGYENLLHYLQHYDLSGYEVRKIPDTEAAHEQKLHTMSGVKKCLHTVLMNNLRLPLAVNAREAWPKWKKAKPGDQFINWRVISDLMKSLDYPRDEYADTAAIGEFLTKLAGKPVLSSAAIPNTEIPDEYMVKVRVFPLSREYDGGRVTGYLYELKEWRKRWDELYGPGGWPPENSPDDEEQPEQQELPASSKPKDKEPF